MSLASNNEISNATGEILPQDSCRLFSLAEIQSVTKNFDKALVIGEGGFGKVYKGFIDDGATTVAIKRLNAESKQGAKEFWTEIKMLSKLQHTHLVALVGYCDDSEEMILVYEYMPCGTLADHLHKIHRKGSGSNSSIPYLTWEQRLDISIGAARGLDYLHTGTNQSFIHRDVKTSNILLDKKWLAKISDFGLSKIIASHSVTHVTTSVKGTHGYMDPDYYRTRRLSTKSDVYAFGVVLLEVLCGRPAVDNKLDEDRIDLVYWAQQLIEKQKFDQIIDPSLSGQISQHCLKCFLKIVNKCLLIYPQKRPAMAEVITSLELALASQHKGRTEGTITAVFQRIAFVPKAMNCWSREGKDNDSKSGPTKQSFHEPTVTDQPFQEPSVNQLRYFSITEIRTATDNFSEGSLIRKGWSGNVYKGCIDDRTLSVAIKRFKELTTQQLNKIRCEIEKYSRPHPHIVSLIGFCHNNDELILVYDYMANGSLQDHLHGTDNDPLLWKRRLEICIDAMQGLLYLHEERGVTHRGIKSSKILLDGKWVAKVMGYTLSKQLPVNISSDRTPIRVPVNISSDRTPIIFSKFPDSPLHPIFREYVHNKVKQKSDMYLFGVVLLEVLCAKKPFNHERHWEEPPLVRGFQNSIKSENIDQIIDPYLTGKIAPECLREFIKTTLRCLLDQGIEMGEVVVSLHSALQLQEAWENRIKIGTKIDPSSYNDVCKWLKLPYSGLILGYNME